MLTLVTIRSTVKIHLGYATNALVENGWGQPLELSISNVRVSGYVCPPVMKYGLEVIP